MITNEINHLWIMDPIDGTANCKTARRVLYYIGVFYEGKPMLSYVYDYPHKSFIKHYERRCFCNGIKMEEPPSLKLEDAIISLDYGSH